MTYLERELEKRRERKKMSKEHINNMKAGNAPIDVDEVKAKIELLNQSNEPLSNTGKRRLRLLNKLKKLGNQEENIEEDVPKQSTLSKETLRRRERRKRKIVNTISEQDMQNKMWEEDTKATETRISKIFNKSAKDKIKIEKIKVEKKEEVEEPSNDSDYEVEHIVKPDGKMDAVNNENKSYLDIFENDNKKGKKAFKKKEKDAPFVDFEMENDGSDVNEKDSDEPMDAEVVEVKTNNDDNVEDGDDVKPPKNKKPKKLLKLLNKDDPEVKPEKQVKLINADQINQLVSKNAKGMVRYVVFVGNLPYDCGKKVLEDHFQKAGEIRDIRIPLEKGSNKPRGFAYVEMTNTDGYQRALSLHHTSIGGRRINVNYTETGKKKPEQRKSIVKGKNAKINYLRKKGMLIGSNKEGEKRRDRRKKQKN